jgi:hypothetical protein
MMKFDAGDPESTFLHRLFGYWTTSHLIQLVILHGNWPLPRRSSKEICRESWDPTNLVWNGCWTFSVRNKRQLEYKCRASCITISFSNDRKISPQSSPETRVGIIGLMRNRRCRHDHAMIFQQGHFRKLIRQSRRSHYFSAARNLHSLILHQKARIYILTISTTLFWRDQSQRPCWNTKSVSERSPYPYGQL